MVKFINIQMLIDANNMLSILNTAVNESDHDIQKLENGEKTLENADKLDDETLSRYKDERNINGWWW